MPSSIAKMREKGATRTFKLFVLPFNLFVLPLTMLINWSWDSYDFSTSWILNSNTGRERERARIARRGHTESNDQWQNNHRSGTDDRGSVSNPRCPEQRKVTARGLQAFPLNLFRRIDRRNSLESRDSCNDLKLISFFFSIVISISSIDVSSSRREWDESSSADTHSPSLKVPFMYLFMREFLFPCSRPFSRRRNANGPLPRGTRLCWAPSSLTYSSSFDPNFKFVLFTNIFSIPFPK